MSFWEIVLAILGMGVVTLLTRSFFLIPKEDLPMPDWIRQGLRYAPLAALMAVIAPAVVMSDGQLISTWRDARLFAVAAGTAWFVWKQGILGTILCGTAVMLALRLTLGW